MTTSSALISAGRSAGRADSIFGANAVTACLAPVKLTWRGSRPFSPAATAITVRSRLYASKWAQISLRTISGVLHRRTSICIVDLIERMSASVYQPQCLLCHTLYRPLAPAYAAGGRDDGLRIRPHLGVVNPGG